MYMIEEHKKAGRGYSKAVMERMAAKYPRWKGVNRPQTVPNAKKRYFPNGA